MHMQRWEHQFRNVELFHACAVIIGLLRTAQLTGQIAVGIDIGNECWHHDILPDQQIGYTIIRGCHIKDVGVCGIAGLFAEHVLIEDNLIEGTGWQKMELSWEAAGIKLHNSVGSLFRRNIFKTNISCRSFVA